MHGLADVGYGHELSWTYPYRQRQRIATFEAEHALVGDRLVTLLNAGKRLHLHARPATIQKAAGSIRILSRAIANFAPDSTLPAEWHRALVLELSEKEGAERTRWSVCNHANAVLREVARAHGVVRRFNNPFSRASASIPILEADAVSQLRRCARGDAEASLRDYYDVAPSPYREFVDQARLMAARNGGALPLSSDREFNTFLARIRRETKPLGRCWDSRDLASRLYATMEATLPFFILLVDKLAANVDAIAEMRRDCMTEFDNPVTGKRYLIDVPKPRSGENVPPYSVADYGPLSVPAIIRFILAYTEPLVPLASPGDRNFLFLVDTPMRNVLPLIAIPTAVAFKSYKRVRGLNPKMTLNMLRPTRLVKEYERTLDPFRVQRMARQSRLSSLAPYLNHDPAELADERVIASAQQLIVEQRFRARSVPTASTQGAGSLSSHLCMDPNDPAHGLDQHGLCVNFLWPLNDRHFVMDFEPRTVAFLLRDYEAICEAEKRIPHARFVALYAPRKALIEERFLPQVPEDVLQEAQIIMTQLPSPRVD